MCTGVGAGAPVKKVFRRDALAIALSAHISPPRVRTKVKGRVCEYPEPASYKLNVFIAQQTAKCYASANV